MSRFNGHFVLGDLRKFCEQHGDAIGWDQSNRAYILTHGVSGIDWKHYKHLLPEGDLFGSNNMMKPYFTTFLLGCGECKNGSQERELKAGSPEISVFIQRRSVMVHM